MADKNERFIREPGMGLGAMIVLVLAGVLVFGALAYALTFHGDVFSLPRPAQ